jgi:hypothetical protein
MPEHSTRACRIALAIATLSILVMPARASEAAQSRIVNGVETQARATTGALLVGNRSNFVQICSGTLVGCETFLTAAHCVCPGSTFCEPDASGFFVYLQHGGIVGAAGVAVEPGYHFGEEHDVAVVTLGAAVTGIPPSAINESGDPAYGTSATIAGYGITTGGRNDSGLLREGNVVTSNCQSGVPEPAHVCWTFENPVGEAGVDSNTCSGDSGGPLFADLGEGTRVIGITSGGFSTNCLPSDLSFDTNVFRDAAFIRAVAGADLDSPACGGVSQVGDGRTEVVEISGTTAFVGAARCRKLVTKSYTKYVTAALKARMACLDDVGAGVRPGPCPDAAASAELARAAAGLSEERLARSCGDADVVAATLAGLCAAATTTSELAACLLEASEAAVASLVDVAYAFEETTGAVEAPACQRCVGKALAKYEKKSLELRTRCQNRLDQGRVQACPDAATTDKIASLAARIQGDVARGCDDGDIAALDAESSFGGVCEAAASVGAFATCSAAAFDAANVALVGILADAGGAIVYSFDVPEGTALLRVTLNGIDAGRNDIDLYLRPGEPPTTEDWLLRGYNGGVFEAVERAAPAAGPWYALVDEFDGSGIAHQLTITYFEP